MAKLTELAEQYEDNACGWARLNLPSLAMAAFADAAFCREADRIVRAQLIRRAALQQQEER